MIEDKDKSYTALSEIGEFGLIDRIQKSITLKNPDSILGIGDDAAVFSHENTDSLISTDMLVEGVHFDFMYTPVKHLGYKAIAVNVSDIVAMGGTPTAVLVSIAASNRMSVEAIDELYAGIRIACEKYKVDLIGGDTTSSLSGLNISVTALGKVEKGKAITRSGAQEKDLIVLTGDLGAAYMGLQVLEREKEVYKVNPNVQPDLEQYEYLLQRQLRPEARIDILPLLQELGVQPTSMIDISDGLSSELLHLCKSSNLGCQVYEEKIPIDPAVFKACEEMDINAVTAALNGGEDYELLFTIPLSDFGKIKGNPHLTSIGHMTESGGSPLLVTNMGTVVEIKAQGWKSFKDL